MFLNVKDRYGILIDALMGPTQSIRPPNQNILGPLELISFLYSFEEKTAQNQANLMKTIISCLILENLLYVCYFIFFCNKAKTVITSYYFLKSRIRSNLNFNQNSLLFGNN